MIAYHFPPLAGSSGIQRTLRFVQHLPAFDWQPLVLTADPRAYEKTSPDLLADVPPNTVVRRAFALDTARHLNLGGRYFGWMARPDRWVSWKFAAIREGCRLIQEHKPDVIWSTYPIATAHVIASALHKRTGIPWIADFRDPMAQVGYPADPLTRQSFIRIETDAAANGARCTFTTPGAAEDYCQRYPNARSRVVVLENGYDEESFAAVKFDPAWQSAAQSGTGTYPLILLHSGIVYPSERDPAHLFAALQRLRANGALGPDDIRIRFRASVHDELLKSLATKYGIQEMIELCAAIPYRQALSEMMSVDVLLVMQASNCNAQIPAKVYEYLRAGRPILGLTDPVGDTASVLRDAGVTDIARLDSVDDIATALVKVVHSCRRGELQLPQAAAVGRASRRQRSAVFVKLLDEVVLEHSMCAPIAQ